MKKKTTTTTKKKTNKKKLEEEFTSIQTNTTLKTESTKFELLS